MEEVRAVREGGERGRESKEKRNTLGKGRTLVLLMWEIFIVLLDENLRQWGRSQENMTPEGEGVRR